MRVSWGGGIKLGFREVVKRFGWGRSQNQIHAGHVAVKQGDL